MKNDIYRDKVFDENNFRQRMHDIDYRLFVAESFNDAEQKARIENKSIMKYHISMGHKKYSQIIIDSCHYEGTGPTKFGDKKFFVFRLKLVCIRPLVATLQK